MQCWFEMVAVVGIKLWAFVAVVGELIRFVELKFGKSVGEIA